MTIASSANNGESSMVGLFHVDVVMRLAQLIHLLSAVVWVGGMFFAYLILRPVATRVLEPPQRLLLWQQVLQRFFNWVWLSVFLILASGILMIILYGGMGAVNRAVHVMLAIGVIMMAIFAHVFFSPYRRLTRLTSAQDWNAAAASLAQIRKLVGLNLVLGLTNLVVIRLGPLFF